MLPHTNNDNLLLGILALDQRLDLVKAPDPTIRHLVVRARVPPPCTGNTSGGASRTTRPPRQRPSCHAGARPGCASRDGDRGRGGDASGRDAPQENPLTSLSSGHCVVVFVMFRVRIVLDSLEEALAQTKMGGIEGNSLEAGTC